MPPLSTDTLSDARTLAAYLIFSGSYLVFAIGKFPGLKIDRTGAAIIGAVLMFAFHIVTPADAVRSVDAATLVLLFSMMLIVSNLRLVGFFDWVTEAILKKLHPHHLLPTVILLSGVLSAFFVNDIVCLVMVPLVLVATRAKKVAPVPFLLAVATASNIGSVATITGNPQNILIGSFSGLAYSDFLLHLGPVAALGLLANWGILHWIFHRKGIPDPPPDEVHGAAPPSVRQLRKAGIVILLVVLGFLGGIPPAMMAAVGAAMLLVTRTLEPRKIYAHVDWSLLVFFIGLFLIVGGAENAGLTQRLLHYTRDWNLQDSSVFTIVTAVFSNLVSNVPAVMLMKSLIPGFADPHAAWLLLAMASTLAGNLTITVSIANIIVVETARPEVEIGYREYLRVGIPVTVATLLIGWIWLTMIHL
ncbi:MAG: anion transporter [Acidobacteria bacterium]|nr:anion transporter [Acidobacteriota bacterium]